VVAGSGDRIEAAEDDDHSGANRNEDGDGDPCKEGAQAESARVGHFSSPTVGQPGISFAGSASTAEEESVTALE
jgi:hypothetical protein